MEKYTSVFTGAEIDGRLAAVADAFDPDIAYDVGDLCVYEGHLYRKIQNPGSGGWVIADWQETTLASSIDAYRFDDPQSDGNIIISRRL